jgi:hypothetical protein
MSPIHTLAHHHISSLSDVTAFSALPDAPVLPYRPSRSARIVAAWRGRRDRLTQTPSLRRPATVGHIGKGAPAPAAACRMVA